MGPSLTFTKNLEIYKIVKRFFYLDVEELFEKEKNLEHKRGLRN